MILLVILLTFISCKEDLKKELSFEDSIYNKLNSKSLLIGESLYNSKCKSCHGHKGQGGLGKALNDDKWINGDGTKGFIYKTLVYGIPKKGMPSWEGILKDDDFYKLIYYIESLKK